MTGRFCGQCGAAAGTSGSTAEFEREDGLTDNAASALCYALGVITGLLFLAWAPYNQKRSVRFHAFQSIFLNAAALLLLFAAGILVPGWTLKLLVGRLIQLAAIGVWIYMMWQTYQGNKIKLPVIGDMAEKQV